MQKQLFGPDCLETYILECCDPEKIRSLLGTIRNDSCLKMQELINNFPKKSVCLIALERLFPLWFSLHIAF